MTQLKRGMSKIPYDGSLATSPLNQGKCEVIPFVVNTGVNVTASNIFKSQERSFFESSTIDTACQRKKTITIPLFARNPERRPWTPFTSWESYIQSDRLLHQKCWTTTSWSSLPSQYRQKTRSSICLTFIGYRRCIKSIYKRKHKFIACVSKSSTKPFSILLTKLTTHNEVFRSTARQPTQEVGSVRCRS